jgi:hypothetical protein
MDAQALRQVADSPTRQACRAGGSALRATRRSIAHRWVRDRRQRPWPTLGRNPHARRRRRNPSPRTSAAAPSKRCGQSAVRGRCQGSIAGLAPYPPLTKPTAPSRRPRSAGEIVVEAIDRAGRRILPPWILTQGLRDRIARRPFARQMAPRPTPRHRVRPESPPGTSPGAAGTPLAATRLGPRNRYVRDQCCTTNRALLPHRGGRRRSSPKP